MSTAMLALTVVVAIGALFLLIMGLKLHAFVALLTVSLATAVAVGIPLDEIADVVEEGMGGILGFVAIIVGLGAMIGQVLRVTGGAERIADVLLDAFGKKRVPWALGVTGIVVALPVFFDVGLVLLISLVYALSQRLKMSLLVFALPLVGGLSVASSLLPPTPAPVAAAGLLDADLGWVILFGLPASLAAVAVGGVLYGRFIGSRIEVPVPQDMAEEMRGGTGQDGDEPEQVPSFALILTIILTPLALIMGNTVTEALLPEDHGAVAAMALVGHPIVAMLVALLLAFYVLGMRHGLDRERLQSVASSALTPVGLVLLVTGGGGVFGEVLERSGLGDALEEVLQATAIPFIVLAFLAAAVMRVALGSGTVATVTGAAIVAQVAEGQDLSAPMLAAVVAAVGAGATVLSHVNDSGFWLVGKFLNMDEKQTLMTWTVMQTIMGVTAFVVVLIMSAFLT
ncbi:GntP family permease [Cellulomonas bogoriensis]|uniref:Gluconate transporter n=1 Tax=Cellulomonas bogoriensis 69B4 = DSM 16987 TaxID=1386082 RepID=A0A0A0C2C6_9CELL|nr:gluconate:H+ symporter [Cellulomonas bogoriensis]KGM14320.1 gluconate transporter [Cellulomonas bogoriensis 69B4 = DSM 16987]